MDHIDPKSKKAADREWTLLSEIVRLLAREAAREWAGAAQQADLPKPASKGEELRT